VVRRVIFSDDDDRIVELRWKVSGGGDLRKQGGKAQRTNEVGRINERQKTYIYY
jgi:hypothetical protein